MMVPPYNIKEICNAFRKTRERPRWTTPMYMHRPPHHKIFGQYSSTELPLPDQQSHDGSKMRIKETLENPCLTNRWHCTMIDQSAIAIGPYPGKNMRRWHCTMIDQSAIAIGPYPGKNMRRFLIGCRLLRAKSKQLYA
jgi:hypothetical protein